MPENSNVPDNQKSNGSVKFIATVAVSIAVLAVFGVVVFNMFLRPSDTANASNQSSSATSTPTPKVNSSSPSPVTSTPNAGDVN